MTYNQLRELEKCAPTPVEYNPPDEQEFVPDMPDRTHVKVDQLMSKLIAIRAKAGSK